MNPDRQQAIDYLRSPGTPWRWAEDGAVLVWKDGTTIAFREEVIQVIETLAPRGLPPFGSVVYLLAAARDKVATASELVTETDPPSSPALQQIRHRLISRLNTALDTLAKVGTLPPDLRSGLPAKCLLAEAVFEAAEFESRISPEAILRGLQSPLTDSELNAPDLASAAGTGRIRQIHLVAEHVEKLSIESLRLRMETGLDVLPDHVDTALPAAERARQLIEDLSRDRELGPVGRAARELLAAVRLPRRLTRREELALGGMADLTNRGPLDRLLLSELAHDDLTLATRVALNEALYIQREPPQREPPGTLAFLLDSGVRLWGVPRVLATAVALAMIARDKRHPSVLAWRAGGGRITPVELTSRRGVILHLGALETDAHPGDALSLFADAAGAAENRQAIVVTHPDTLEDPDFRHALNRIGSRLDFVATVDRKGRFELHSLPLSNRLPLCQADLDLARIFPPDEGTPPVPPKLNPELPSILAVRPFPFLLPVAGTPDIWTLSPDGFYYVVLNDRRLVRFQDPRKGAEELGRDLPPGKSTWIDCFHQTVYVVKSGNSNRPVRLISYSVDGDRLSEVSLSPGKELRAVFREGDVLILIQPDEALAFSVHDGRPLDRLSYQKANQSPMIHWNHGRYFRGANGFFAITWNGAGLGIQPVTLPASVPDSANVVKLFDRRDHEGPWALLDNGLLIFTGSDVSPIKIPIEQPLNFSKAKVSRNGDQLFIPRFPLPGVEFSPGHLVSIPDNPQEAKSQFLRTPKSSFEPAPPFPSRNLFRVIEAIAFPPEGPIFVGRKGCRRQIILEHQPHQLIRIVPFVGTNDRSHATIPFQPAFETERGCQLQRGEFACGSRVFLDSRGLLHFKSHDASVPEVSLVLCDGQVGGWTSDGYVCGPAFFFRDEHRSNPAAVFDRLMQFMKRL